jgi:quercetin dioxygenase-like cupin family protein
MPTLVGFGTFAALSEERISDKISRRILSGDQGMIVWWSIGAGVHVEPHSHANEQIVWMLKGKMEFRLGSEQRVCGPGDVVVIPGGTEHEAWFREDTEVIGNWVAPAANFPASLSPVGVTRQRAEEARRTVCVEKWPEAERSRDPTYHTGRQKPSPAAGVVFYRVSLPECCRRELHGRPLLQVAD